MNELIAKILLFVVAAAAVAFLALCPSPISPDVFDTADEVGADTGEGA